MGFALDHLSYQQRETIARGCIVVKEIRGEEIHGLCPFHNERKASFSYNVQKDLCNCLSCGAKGDLITMWGHVNGCGDSSEAFKEFKAQFAAEAPPPHSGKPLKRSARGAGGEGKSSNLEAPEEVTKVIPEREWERLSLLPTDWVRRCREKFGWSDEVITRYQLRLWVPAKGDKRIAIPIRRDDGALVNVRLYLPGAKENKMMSWGKGYGKNKLFPCPDTWGEDTSLLCEGEKDTLLALSLGFNAVTQTAGCNSWDDKFNRFFAGRDVVIAYDADEKGRAGAKKVAEKLLGVARSVRIILWPAFMGMTEDHGKDLTDFFMEFGKTAEDLKDLIAVSEQLSKPSARAEAIPEDVARFFGGARGTQFKPRMVADEILRNKKVIYEPKAGVVHQWNGRSWEEYGEANIRNRALHMLGTEATSSRVTDVCRMVIDLALMQPDRLFNDSHNLLPLHNCMFDLAAEQVLPHDPDYLNTYTLDITMNLEGEFPDCPTFKQFMIDFIPDNATRREVLKFAGYCLTRDTRYEKALFLIGPGGDGKSTFLRVLESILGEINVSNVSLGALEDQFQRIMLKDKLLNVTTEIESGLLQSGMFKAIVSGDRISASYKHRDGFSFKPVAKHIFAANKFPPIQDTTKGLYRKMMIVEVKKSFAKPDLDLTEKLWAERDAIFLMLVRHLQLLREEGFVETAYMNSCLARFMEANNPIVAFVNSHIEEREGVKTEVLKVYEKYNKFCRLRGYLPKAESTFGRELRNVMPGIERVRDGGGLRRWFYRNVEIVDDTETAYAA